MEFYITQTLIEQFRNELQKNERSRSTVRKYDRDLQKFFCFLPEEKWIDKEAVLKYKEHLIAMYAPGSVNSMLAALNKFFQWAGVPQFKVKPLKIQKAVFYAAEKELTKEEYIRLVMTAEKLGDQRLSLILQTICVTGIRVSELEFITVEAVAAKKTVAVNCKGKHRVIFMQVGLCEALERYCHEKGIREGAVFQTKRGRPVDRSNIWRLMKTLCAEAGVEAEKVYPHNLRHLFAKTYYTMEKDICKLADLLGHSSVNTTRIYTMESGSEHARQIEKMGLFLDRRP